MNQASHINRAPSLTFPESLVAPKNERVLRAQYEDPDNMFGRNNTYRVGLARSNAYRSPSGHILGIDHTLFHSLGSVLHPRLFIAT